MNKEFKKFTLMDETLSAPASDKTIMIDDFEKLAIKLWKESDDRTGNPPYIYSLGVEHGYNNAKESLYTEEQVKQAINRAVMLTLSDKSCYSDEIIKSLKK